MISRTTAGGVGSAEAAMGASLAGVAEPPGAAGVAAGVAAGSAGGVGAAFGRLAGSGALRVARGVGRGRACAFTVGAAFAFGAGFAFPVHQRHANARELLFNLVANGVHLPRAEAGAHQKTVRKRAKPLEIKQRYLRRLLFLRGGDGHAKFGL